MMLGDIKNMERKTTDTTSEFNPTLRENLSVISLW